MYFREVIPLLNMLFFIMNIFYPLNLTGYAVL